MGQKVNQDLIDKFGQRVREVRKDRGLTMREFAKKSGIPLSQISRIELGQVNTTINTAGILAKTLDVPLVHLFQEKDLLD